VKRRPDDVYRTWFDVTSTDTVAAASGGVTQSIADDDTHTAGTTVVPNLHERSAVRAKLKPTTRTADNPVSGPDSGDNDVSAASSDGRG
jgi:hypothetical protein